MIIVHWPYIASCSRHLSYQERQNRASDIHLVKILHWRRFSDELVNDKLTQSYFAGVSPQQSLCIVSTKG